MTTGTLYVRFICFGLMIHLLTQHHVLLHKKKVQISKYEIFNRQSLLFNSEIICEDGYIYYYHTSKCYKLYVEEKTWDQGKLRCNLEGGELVSIHDLKTNVFYLALVLQYISETGVKISSTFTGGYYNHDDENWYWSDGSSWNYQNWHTEGWKYIDGKDVNIGQPNRFRDYDDVIKMRTDWPNFRWNDAPKSNVYMETSAYLCQRKNQGT